MSSLLWPSAIDGDHRLCRRHRAEMAIIADLVVGFMTVAKAVRSCFWTAAHKANVWERTPIRGALARVNLATRKSSGSIALAAFCTSTLGQRDVIFEPHTPVKFPPTCPR